MDLITGLGSLRYIDQALRKFQNDGRASAQDGVQPPIDDVYVPSDPSSLRGWSSRESHDYAVESVEDSIGRDPLSDSRQDPSEEGVALRRRSSSSSNWSVLSNTTTLSQSEHRARQKSQLAKLLPRSSDKPSQPEAVQKQNIFSSLHGSLKRGIPISRSTESAGLACAGNEVGRETKGSVKKPHKIVPQGLRAPSCKASLEKDANHQQDNGPGGNLHGKGLPKRSVPQGCQLAEAQLALQEVIITSIHDQAVRSSQVSNERKKGKDRNDRTDDEEEPEQLDRKLEVTREITKQVQMCLSDESYKDLYLLDAQGKEISVSEKYATLSDIFLMVRRTFRDLLVSCERPYRPTGVAVTDQELLEDFDGLLLARKNLLRRYPSMSIEDILDSLGGGERKADVGTLAALGTR